MRTHLQILLSMAVLSACEPWKDVTDTTDGDTQNGHDLECPAPPDLMPASPKCAAAKGLAGDNLLCVDFSSISDQTLMNPPPQALSGWDFGNPANCWEVAAGKLQIKGFSGFATTCSFKIPALSTADYNKYNSFTLSVVQTVDVNTTKQAVSVYLGSPVAAQQMWYTTGTFPKTTTTLQIARSVLPNGGSNAYQPLFQITSAVAGGGFAGWQIESVAVMGNP